MRHARKHINLVDDQHADTDELNIHTSTTIHGDEHTQVRSLGNNPGGVAAREKGHEKSTNYTNGTA